MTLFVNERPVKSIQKKTYGTRLFVPDILNHKEVIKGSYFEFSYRPHCKNKDAKIYVYELCINARSTYRAQEILDLLTATISLTHSEPIFEIRQLLVYPLDNDDEAFDSFWFPNDELRSKINDEYHIGNIPLACEVAAKLSYKKSLINSVYKYYLSSYLCSMHPIDLQPFYYYRLSPFLYDHLRFAYAIVIAYSILEELELEIRASKKNPSKIRGNWNPVVKNELERRLRKANIDINEPITWMLRGPRKKLELLKPLKFIRNTSWSRGNVRDCEVKIINAISWLSWVRSKFLAHKFSKDIASLSVYDVSNAQLLMKRLLLEHIKMWPIYDYE